MNRLDVDGVKYEGCGALVSCSPRTIFGTHQDISILMCRGTSSRGGTAYCGTDKCSDGTPCQQTIGLCEDCQARLGLIW